MIVVGIDPGTKTGYAIRDEYGMRESGVWKLQRKGAPNRYTELETMLHAWLGMLLSETGGGQPIKVAYEDVRAHRGTTAAHVYGGLVGVILIMCVRFKVDPIPVPVGTVKKFATGKGNASKDMMIDAAWRRWPQGGQAAYTSDEADAMWIAECAWARLKGVSDDK